MTLEAGVKALAEAIAVDVKALVEVKVDKVSGKGLSDTNFTQVEKTKLSGVAVGSTKNRADSLNADKTHTHTTAQVTGLDTTLAGKADKTTQVIAGTGLAGGGTLASNLTLNVSYGTTAGTAAQGNDVRINNGQTAFGWGSHASAGYAKTKADVGLSGIPNTNASTANFLRGDGTWVTPPNTNTTYAEITAAEIDAGTASTLRTISGRRMKYALDKKSDTGHGHSISDVTGLQAAIDSKANTSTQVIAGAGLSGGGSLEADRTLSVNYGTAEGTAAQGNDSRITGALQKSQVVQTTGTSTTNVMSQKETTDQLATKAASSHTHPWSQVTGQPATATRWPTFAEVTGKPTTFTPSSHTHTTAQVTGLDSALDSKASKTELTTGLGLKVDKVTGKGLSDTNFTQVEKTKLVGIATEATKNRDDSANADKVHTHTTAQVSGLGTAATKDVGTSDGNVMEVGAFGLGLPFPSAVFDANEIADLVNRRSGFYPFMSNAGSLNVPHIYVYIQQLFRMTNVTQIAYGYNIEATWVRYRYQGVWSPWVKQLSTTDVKASTGTSTDFPMSQAAVTDQLSTKAPLSHTHAISDVTGLSSRLSDIDVLIGDVESALIIINGEP